MTSPQKAIFSSESEMCAKFIAAVGAEWTCYAETCGWDILLSRIADRFQIGIQAKLKFNTDVLNQSLEDTSDLTRPGPDCRAVLVPSYASGRLGKIADYIGITVIYVRPECDRNAKFYPYLPLEQHGLTDHWYEQAPLKRHSLPEYVPDVAAGAAAPIQLTRWKIGAIKIAVTLEVRGYVTREDFKAAGIDHRRWVPQGWVTSNSGRMSRAEAMPDFKRQHPRVYAEIMADKEKWLRRGLFDAAEGGAA